MFSHAKGYGNVMIAFVEMKMKQLIQNWPQKLEKFVESKFVIRYVVHWFNNRWRWCCGRFQNRWRTLELAYQRSLSSRNICFIIRFDFFFISCNIKTYCLLWFYGTRRFFSRQLWRSYIVLIGIRPSNHPKPSWAFGTSLIYICLGHIKS